MEKGLNASQRDRVAEKIMEWGNLVFVGLVIAQIVPGPEQFSSGVAISGLVVAVVAYSLAYVIMKGGGAR